MCEINNKQIFTILINKAAILLAALLFSLSSCDEASSLEILAEKNDSIVTTRIFNAKFNLKDSGYSKVKLTSPIVEMYELIDTPITVFPKGLELNFFKKQASKPGFMRASYAQIIEKKGLYEARGNVIVVNDEGDSLKTQQLFWNKNTKRITTPDTTTIIRKDGTTNIAAQGMDASEDFKEFIFTNNRGKILVKD